MGCNLRIGGRDDLRAAICAAQVNLVAIVVRRVVRCGDHHACAKPKVFHGECHERGGSVRFKKQNADAPRRDNLSAVLRKNATVLAAVETDHNRGLFIGGVLDQVHGQTKGRLGNEHAVHAVRAGSQFAAKARGAKCQASTKSALQLRLVFAGDERGQLCARLGVGVLVVPGLGLCQQFSVHVRPA